MNGSKALPIITLAVALGAAGFAITGVVVAHADGSSIADRQSALETTVGNSDVSTTLAALTTRIDAIDAGMRDLNATAAGMGPLRRQLNKANACLIEIGSQVEGGLEVSYGWASVSQGLSAPCNEFIYPNGNNYGD